MFTCSRCGAVFKQKQGLQRHLMKENPCDPILEDTDRQTLLDTLKNPVRKSQQQDVQTTLYQCGFCSRDFRDRSNMRKHELVCKKRPASQVSPHLTEEEIKRRIDEQVKKQVEAIKQELKNTKQVVYNFNAPVYAQQNNQIQTNPFGKEDVSYITEEQKTRYMLQMRPGFLDLVKSIHFNDEQPQNQNVRFKSMKQNIIEVLEGDPPRWVQHDSGWVLDNIVAHGYRILYKHFIANFNKDFMQDRSETIQEFLSSLGADAKDKNGRLYYNIRREIFIMTKQHAESNSATLYLVAPHQQDSTPPPSPLDLDMLQAH